MRPAGRPAGRYGRTGGRRAGGRAGGGRVRRNLENNKDSRTRKIRIAIASVTSLRIQTNIPNRPDISTKFKNGAIRFDLSCLFIPLGRY